MNPARYIVTFEVQHQGDDPDGVRRLRMGLKRMLRTFGLKCVRVEPAVHSRHEPEQQNPTT